MFLKTIFIIYQQINYLDFEDVRLYHLFIILKNSITLYDSFITALILYNELFITYLIKYHFLDVTAFNILIAFKAFLTFFTALYNFTFAVVNFF